MDCAKAAATFCLCDGSVTDFLATGRDIPTSHLPIIAIPTTSGTGSEVTSVSVLSDHTRGVKAPMNAPGFYPTFALVDPELTLTAPAHTTACTGFDALCHAIEAYWSRNHQPVCDVLAVHAAKLALDNIVPVFNQLDNSVLRENMAEASLVAGLAFALPKTSSAHACSYPLTNLFGIAHGEACAMTISHFLRFNAENGCERVETLAKALGYNNAHALADRIDEVRRETGMRLDLKDLQLSDEQFEQLVAGCKHPNMQNNPVEVPEAFVRTMFEKMR